MERKKCSDQLLKILSAKIFECAERVADRIANARRESEISCGKMNTILQRTADVFCRRVKLEPKKPSGLINAFAKHKFVLFFSLNTYRLHC